MDEEFNNNEMASWEIPAYQHYERGALWYVLAGIICGGLLIIAFFTSNFLLAVLVVLSSFVVVIQGGSHPPNIEISIEKTGIRRGSRFFPYKSIDRFWIVYDPPIKSLHFIVPRALFSIIHIPLDGQDPNELRMILKKYIHEDIERDSEPLSDSISRILKI
jgi:hypothetical protein